MALQYGQLPKSRYNGDNVLLPIILKTGLGGLGAAWGLLAPAAASAAGFDESAIANMKYKSSGEKQKCT